MTELPVSCRCGALHGRLEVGRGTGTRIACHCDSCVRAQRHFGVAATHGAGVDLWQTTPDRLTIEAGLTHLALARLSPKGSFRWFAACCNSQIGITAGTARFPFVSLVTTCLRDTAPLGPVRAHAFVPQPGGGTRTVGLGRMLRAMAARSLGALISGRWRRTPFFDVATGAPVAPPQLLPKDAGRP